MEAEDEVFTNMSLLVYNKCQLTKMTYCSSYTVISAIQLLHDSQVKC